MGKCLGTKKVLLYDIPMRLKMEKEEEKKQHDIERNFFLRIDRFFFAIISFK